MRPSRSSLLVVLVACGGPRGAAAPAIVRECPADRTVVLAGQDDVARFAGCTTASGLAIRTGMKLDLSPLRALEEITGDLVVGPTVGLEEVKLGELRNVGGAIELVSNANLHGVFLPRLAEVGRVSIDNNVSLTSISMPQLQAVRASFVVTANHDLELIDVAMLGEVGNELALVDNGRLALVEAVRLTRIGAARIENNRSLPVEVVDALKARQSK